MSHFFLFPAWVPRQKQKEGIQVEDVAAWSKAQVEMNSGCGTDGPVGQAVLFTFTVCTGHLPLKCA
jgi:hypothetical protein